MNRCYLRAVRLLILLLCASPIMMAQQKGTVSFVLSMAQPAGKLAALVPPPRFNLVRYHGVLAPSSRRRSHIVPAVSIDVSSSLNYPVCPVTKGKKKLQGKDDRVQIKNHPRNYGWAELMKRVFGFDVLRCERCGGPMRILCAINPPEAIKKILDCLGLPSNPPLISPTVLEKSTWK
jgi:hypothetical protein